MNQIIFYDFINKREIECINHIDISRNDIFNIGMISKELLFVTSEGKKYHLIDVNDHMIINSDKILDEIYYAYFIKGQYMIASSGTKLEIYYFYKNSIYKRKSLSSMSKFFKCIVCLDNGDGGTILGFQNDYISIFK